MRILFWSTAFFLLLEDDNLVIPEVPTNEAVTDLVVAFEEEPRDSGVDPESSPGMISLPFFLTFLFFFAATCWYTFLFFCQLTGQRILTTSSHPWMQVLMMLRISSWRQKVFCRSSKKVLCSDNLDIDFWQDNIHTFSSFIGRLWSNMRSPSVLFGFRAGGARGWSRSRAYLYQFWCGKHETSWWGSFASIFDWT